ncbi:MAG: FAD-binding oxidoreductase, partial [Polyangiales bacterium]
MSTEFYELQVAGIIQETHDTRSFVFAVPESLRGEFRYRAGQFLTFEVLYNGMQLRRCYSLSSAPETDAWPKVTVKRV